MVLGIPLIILTIFWYVESQKIRLQDITFYLVLMLWRVPLAKDKRVGPSQTLTYLGIKIDAYSQIIFLLTEKYTELQNNLLGWHSGKMH